MCACLERGVWLPDSSRVATCRVRCWVMTLNMSMVKQLVEQEPARFQHVKPRKHMPGKEEGRLHESEGRHGCRHGLCFPSAETQLGARAGMLVALAANLHGCGCMHRQQASAWAWAWAAVGSRNASPRDTSMSGRIKCAIRSTHLWRTRRMPHERSVLSR